jgi:glucokinase
LRKALLINGPPASGKTTIADQLLPILGYPLLSLDTIKEVLFENLGTGDRDFNRKLGRTSLSIIWALVGDFHKDTFVMIEAWFGSSAFADIECQLQQVGIERVAEIWCHAPGEILAGRYAERVDARPEGHPDESYAHELIHVAQEATPLRIGPVLPIDTSEEEMMSPEKIADWVQQILDQ